MILGIIPARGGSKGIKDKNIRLLNGKPLIQYSIEAARGSSQLDDFFVSTDSEKIKSIAEGAGASVPFLRPSRYATEEATTVSAVFHAVEWYEHTHNLRVNLIVLLQPTTPLRTAEDIDQALSLFQERRAAESLISCYEASHVHPSIMYTLDNDRFVPLLRQAGPQRRQDFPPVYVRNGAIYIVRRDYFVRNKRLISDTPLGYIMPRARSVNIDEEIDLITAEAIMRSLGRFAS